MNEQIEYFFPNSENIEILNKIIKNQGVETCQKKIEKSWIDNSLSKFSFGYAYITQKAQIGRRSLKKIEDKYYLHGFVLCRLDSKLKNVIWIDLVCSKDTSKVGKLLIELAEETIRKNKNIKLIQLYCIYQLKLKNWYNKLGYDGDSVDIWDGKPKAYLMQKFL